MKKKKTNKKKEYIPILIIITALLIVFILIILNSLTENKRDNTKQKFIYITETHDKVFKDYEKNYEIIKNKETLKEYFPQLKQDEENFSKYNYILLEININSCGEENVKPYDYKIQNDKAKITFQYEAHCGVCAPLYDYYLLPISKNQNIKDLEIKYKALNKPNCDPNIAYKPILYIYPEEKTEVSITFKNPSILTTTYPKYIDKWEVIAEPNGKLIDKKTNREQYALYWEANNHYSKMTDEGFIIEGNNTISFLEEKLKKLGLTEREADEFIIYWLPKLENNKYNYIRFELTEEVNKYMPLEINPQPETLIRILMDYKPLENKIDIKEQIIPQQNRTGYTIVEWGGSLIK